MTARKLPGTDVVIVGLGWTGSILAQELTDAGLHVVAVERGPWRDTASDFPTTFAQDELRYHIRHDLFLRPAQQTNEARMSGFNSTWLETVSASLRRCLMRCGARC